MKKKSFEIGCICPISGRKLSFKVVCDKFAGQLKAFPQIVDVTFGPSCVFPLAAHCPTTWTWNESVSGLQHDRCESSAYSTRAHRGLCVTQKNLCIHLPTGRFLGKTALGRNVCGNPDLCFVRNAF